MTLFVKSIGDVLTWKGFILGYRNKRGVLYLSSGPGGKTWTNYKKILKQIVDKNGVKYKMVKDSFLRKALKVSEFGSYKG